MEVGWGTTATKNASVRYDFTSMEVLGIEKESVQASKHACESGGSFTTLTLGAVPVVLRTARRRIDISEFRGDFNMYRGVNVYPEPAGGVDVNVLLDQDLLWAKAGDAVELLDEVLDDTMALVKEVHGAVPVSKKCYVDLVP